MAKKSKRQFRKSTPAVASPVESGVSSGRFSDREFKPDYSYVIKDLKRIGMLAGSFFVILIILSFILG